MAQHALLIELLTEELPPKALRRLGEAFAQSITQDLLKAHLISENTAVERFATPRRLAVCINDVADQAPEQLFSEKLMPVSVGLNEAGQATPALLKKLNSKGLAHLDVASLSKESDGKQDYLIAKGKTAGVRLADSLQTIVNNAIDHLPIPKVMRYQLADGKTSVKFVRPVHGVVALHGEHIVPINILGISASNITHGHRFMGKADIPLSNATCYAEQLEREGMVIASYEKRLGIIKNALSEQANALGLTIGEGSAVNELLEEVTSLVEHPTIYVGKFEEKFLAVPPECLILTMRLNQKYFPLFDKTTGALHNQFLIVSNMQVSDPSDIIEGNERVVRPRLADAEFFFTTDRKQTLASRVDQLANIVYHNKLGSQLNRVERVRALARYIAEALNGNMQHADRAAFLAKADLTSAMVGEFPELQGIIGAYYAKADNEPDDVAQAIADQYLVRFDKQINNVSSVILFIAERIETLIGIWGIGLIPSGERDPYALRRAALGIISAFDALQQANLFDSPSKLRLLPLLTFAQSLFEQADIHLENNTATDVQHFIYERLRHQLQTDYDRAIVDAVLALHPDLDEVIDRIKAVSHFTTLPEAASLAAANKRIGNLLKKINSIANHVEQTLLSEPAEIALADCVRAVKPIADAHFAKAEFTEALQSVAQTRDVVDAFFNDVMVMTTDSKVRDNRLALLQQLHATMNVVADLSKLAQ